MTKMKSQVSKGMLMCALICGTLASNAVPEMCIRDRCIYEPDKG